MGNRYGLTLRMHQNNPRGKISEIHLQQRRLAVGTKKSEVVGPSRRRSRLALEAMVWCSSGPRQMREPMRRFAAAIVLTALALLAPGARGQEAIGSRSGIPAPLQPGIGVHDPRIRVDPDAVPWRAIGKIQVAPVNFRIGCTATVVGQATVVTAAHCLFNRRTGHYFPPKSLHFLIGYNGSGYAGHAIGVSMTVGKGYDPVRPKQTIGSDWALVLLDQKLGSADRVLPILNELPENEAGVMLGGYQQDHPLILMADTRCRIGGRLVDGSGRLLLRHSCAGTSGVSGALC
jgi:protease YdgD